MRPFSERSMTLLARVVGSRKEHELDALLRMYAEHVGYFRVLVVAWSYLHYGAHAEFARRNGMDALSVLLGAAWQMQARVLCEADARRADEERHRILAEYSDEWNAAVAGIALTC
jgi:hypothetical protein